MPLTPQDFVSNWRRVTITVIGGLLWWRFSRNNLPRYHQSLSSGGCMEDQEGWW